MASGGRLTRRELLGTVAAAGLAGCETDERGEADVETVTPVPVPASIGRSETLELRHSGPHGRAIDDLLGTFRENYDGIEAVERSPAQSADRSAGKRDHSIVAYDGIGAAMGPLTGSLHSQERLWAKRNGVVPQGLLRLCYLDGRRVVIPQVLHRTNCLYYNPEVLSDAGVSTEDYTTVRDLRSDPGSLAERVETLFAQPLRSSRELLALWETLLASRLYRQRQYTDYVGGRPGRHKLSIRRATRDLDAALSMLSRADTDVAPETLLDRVVDGTVGFVRQPTWAGPHLIDRDDATYGRDWAVVPLFASPWAVSFVAWGFAVPRITAERTTPQALIGLATEPGPQRRFGELAGAIPARTDVDVRTHPLFTEQADAYAEATMHVPSIAHGIAVKPPVRRRLERALSAFRSHRTVERVTDELVTGFRTADPL